MSMNFSIKDEPDGSRLNVEVPGASNPVELKLDYYGEKEERFSVMCYSTEKNFMQVQVRYDARGNVVEVYVADGIRISKEKDMKATPWLVERDGK